MYRSTIFAGSNIMGGVCSTIAPLVPELISFNPLIIYAALSIAAMLATLGIRKYQEKYAVKVQKRKTLAFQQDMSNAAPFIDEINMDLSPAKE